MSSTDVVSNIDLSKLADFRSVGKLDPEIAGEGQKILNSEGEQLNWSPPPVRPAIPDMSQIKRLQRYFNRTGYVVFPAWLYHPTEEARLVKNAQEAAVLGVEYRRATTDERGRYGLDYVWDWAKDTQWRPKPYRVVKFDPANPGHGKTYVAAPENPRAAQNQLLEALTEAFTKALRTDGPSKPAKIDDKDWADFQQFKAFQAAQASVSAVESQLPPADVPDPLGQEVPIADEANALNPETERALWVAEAERKGIKVDKRWGIERLKAEVEKAA